MPNSRRSGPSSPNRRIPCPRPTSGPRSRTSCSISNADRQRPATPAAVGVVPIDADPIDRLAAAIVERHRSDLPDLSAVVVCLPDLLPAPRLDARLLAHARTAGHDGLLAPRTTTWRGWLSEALPTLDGRPVVDELERRLRLVEALLEHPGLYSAPYPWGLARALLELVSELTLEQVEPENDTGRFSGTLASAYRLPDGADGALEREALLVHTVWHAWRDQLASEGLLDEVSAYRLRLEHAPSLIGPGETVWFVAPPRLARAERRLLERLLPTGRAHLVVHGRPAPIADAAALVREPPSALTPFGRFVERILAAGDEDGDLIERARDLVREYPASPVRERLRIHRPATPEDEAQTIRRIVRDGLGDGEGVVAVVCEDRRLARRLRALLERDGIRLRDRVGWALSTTRSATAVERLLQTAESDFEHAPLLDLLKSGLVFDDIPDDAFDALVLELERDIVERENVPRGLDHYRRALRDRRRRLQAAGLGNGRGGSPLEDLLDRLESAFSPIRSFLDGRRNGPMEAVDYVRALRETMRRLGLETTLVLDPAGQRLSETLEDAETALASRRIPVDWSGFRSLLGQMLETATFLPDDSETVADDVPTVHLMTLQQAYLLRFSRLVVAGADASHLVGRLRGSPFFNDAVRRTIGLPTRRDRYEERLLLFRAALESAPRVDVVAPSDGALSPWLELLETGHRLAWDETLVADTTRQGAMPAPTGDPPTGRPHPDAPREFVPERWSASRLQRLVDCPYRFFAADCLGLAARDEVREALEKADYGERVHLVLERFHADGATITDREGAIDRLSAIARSVFDDDLARNIVHHGWLARFLAIAPAYVDWQIERQAGWHVERTELRTGREADAAAVHLHGRIDRIDRAVDGGGRALIDYKTGATPTTVEVMSGESVQLPFYALLVDPPPAEALYLRLEKDAVRVPFVLDGPDLESLRKATARRIGTLHRRLAEGAALPAWGDEAACRHCPMSGLCRRQCWEGMDRC